MMSAEYFEAVKTDLQNIGLSIDRSLYRHPSEWDGNHVYALVDSTRQIGQINPETTTSPSYSPTTKIGRTALDLIAGPNPVAFDSHYVFGGCVETESKLLENIRPSSVANAEWRSPIVITQNQKAIGIVKGYGEDTCFALATIRELGLIKGTLSVAHSAVHIDGNPYTRAGHPWQLPVAAFSRFEPIRFSVFAVPSKHRGPLAANATKKAEKRVLNTSHRQIRERAKSLLNIAELLPLIDRHGEPIEC